MLHNRLSDLGEKIFLDRYALKDQKRKDIRVGDKVIVCVDTKTGQREVGHVTDLVNGGNLIRVKLKDQTVVERAKDQIDKPVETEPEQMAARVARGLAAVEKGADKQAEWQKNFEWVLDGWKFVPAGRILAAAGTDQQLTYYNCYVIPSPKDSRRGILDTLYHMTEIMSRGGGVGINLSSLRPKYAYVQGVNGRSSGAVSWGGLYSFVTGLIEQGGSRRGALMLILDDWHPDLLDFITVKEDMTKVTNANLSIGVSDAFMEAVKNDGDWEFVFPDTQDAEYNTVWKGDLKAWKALGKQVKVYKKMKAREVWKQIIHSAWKSAEPGLWFKERSNTMSNSWYFSPLVCTNPCGEQCLPDWGVCNLGHVNLSRFANNEGTDVMWDELRRTVRIAVRFLDNVIDSTLYFFEENEKQQMSERRVGLGTIGMAELLIRLGMRYGSPESLAFMDKLFRFIAVEAYRMSTEIAVEKGVFSQFHGEKFLQSGFMKTMPEEVRALVKQRGIRNVTILTQAPTGTVATMVGTSTGIEPFYSWTYFRKSRLGLHEENVDIVKEWKEKHPHEKTLPVFFASAMDLLPEEHARVQGAIQRWMDSSISKTSNLPNDYTEEQVGEFYQLLYKLGCKGGTVYRDGSRSEQVLMSKDEGEKLKKKFAEDKEAVPVVKVPPVTRAAALTPRVRPARMQGMTYNVRTGYGSLFITVNDDDQGQPFELFATIGKAGGFFAAKSEAICRLVSLAFRSGISVESIIDQLKGIRGPIPYWRKEGMILSIPDAIAQVLEEHVRRKKEQQLQMELPKTESGTAAVAAGNSSPLASAPAENTFAPAAPVSERVFASVVTGEFSETRVSKSPSFAAASETVTTKTKIDIADIGFAPQCPQCSHVLEMSEGCMTCRACGYSKCG